MNTACCLVGSKCCSRFRGFLDVFLCACGTAVRGLAGIGFGRVTVGDRRLGCLLALFLFICE